MGARVRSLILRIPLLVSVSAVVGSCVDRDLPVQPPRIQLQNAAQNSSDDHFFFLPPLVPEPSFTGVFDGSLSPVVQICVWNASECARPLLAEFTTKPVRGSERVRVDSANQLYVVNWHTDRFGLENGEVYRIRVLAAGTELGHADVMLSGTQSLQNVNTGEILRIGTDRTLPIKFRIEEGAVFVVGPNGGTVAAIGGRLTVIVPHGALAAPVGITVRTTVASASGGLLVGPAYELGPTGTVFSLPVTMAIHYDEQDLPTRVRAADVLLATAENGNWVPLGAPDDATGFNDEATHIVSGQITHFSIYASIAPPPPPSPLRLARPWTSSQFWVPQTYDGHVAQSWTKGVDYYYATDQFGGSTRLDLPASIGKAVLAAHDGNARRVVRGPFSCDADWVPSNRMMSFRQYELLITEDGGAFTTDYIHIRINPNVIGTFVRAGDVIGWVADPSDPNDEFDLSGISIVGCANTPHFMLVIWPGATDWAPPYSLDNPDEVLVGEETIFSGPKVTCANCGPVVSGSLPTGRHDVFTYGAMPRGVTVGLPSSIAFERVIQPDILPTIAGRAAIIIRQPNGTETQLTDGSTYLDFRPSWSPDGSKIAFARRTAVQTGSGFAFDFHVYVINVDGTGLTNITGAFSIASEPAWSPKGDRIAFTGLKAGETSGPGIFLVNPDGSGETRLTASPSPQVDVHAAWSPDGSKIAFASTRDGGKSEIYTMNADGSGQTRITNNDAFEDYPTWSADGSRIAFMTDRDGNFEVYVMNANGTNQVNLTNNPEIDGSPAWSPDGSAIAFATKRDGNAEIYIMTPTGTGVVRVTNTPTVETDPAWRR